MSILLMTHDTGETPLPPLVAPYNAPTHLNMPAIYANPSGTHPSVVDFYPETFGGWRYWMAYTPFYKAYHREENPCIVVSNDGTSWVEPEGITNPIAPPPANGALWNADTDLVWDGERFWCWYLLPASELVYRTSTDGIHWSDHVSVLQGDSGLSPSILKAPTGEWRMYWPSGHRTADSLAGPWSAPIRMTYDWSQAGEHEWPSADGARGVWHLSVRHDEGQYRMIFMERELWYMWPAVSEDGVSWRVGPPLMKPTADEVGMYRATMSPAEDRDGEAYDVWYGTTGWGWQISHTQIPMSHWREL